MNCLSRHPTTDLNSDYVHNNIIPKENNMPYIFLPNLSAVSSELGYLRNQGNTTLSI